LTDTWLFLRPDFQSIANTKATFGYSGSLSSHVEDHGVRMMVSVGL
jgi:hypothetical protein